MLRHIIALLFLVACDQGWANPDKDDNAPGAPDCLSDPTLDFCDEGEASAAPDHDKHGPQGANTVHSWPVAQVEGFQSHTCGTGWGQENCWWRWNGYNRLHILTNVPASGEQPRSRTLHHVSWSYCWNGQGATAWDTLPAETAVVCVPGTCVDVTNRHAPSGGNCRSGTLVDELPLTVQPWSYSHVEMWVTPKAGWIGNPQMGVWMNMSHKHKDGP